MCAAEIEDFLRRSSRPKVQRDTSISSEVSIINSSQDAPEVVNTQIVPSSQENEEEKVASTIRLRKSINKALNNFKSEQGITKDAFMEAAWEICQQNSEVMNLITQQATAIADQRRKQGILLRAESALKNLKDN